MRKKTPAFAILRVKALRISDLVATEGHNTRRFAVKGIDRTAKDQAKVLLLKGPDLVMAVWGRIKTSGAIEPGENRNVAAEVILTCSPDADPMPPPELMATRGLTFCRRIFGDENVVAAYQHDDEKTSHLHVVVVPICRGVTPGRPRRGRDLGEAEEERLIVSWSQFSGAYGVDARKDDTRRRRRKKGRVEKSRRNKVMAGWQTEWALEWSDFGLRRGAPSSRSHLPIRWIRGEHAKIAEQAEIGMRLVRESIAGFVLSPEEVAGFLATRSPEIIREALEKRLAPQVDKAQAPLIELAAKGIQLDAERRARADLADGHKELRRQLAVAPSAEGFRLLEEANSALQDDVARLLESQEAARRMSGRAHLASLSDEDFKAVVAAEFRRRQEHPGPVVAAVLMRPLPTPKIGPETSANGPSR